jgi:hypothetical protein
MSILYRAASSWQFVLASFYQNVGKIVLNEELFALEQSSLNRDLNNETARELRHTARNLRTIGGLAAVVLLPRLVAWIILPSLKAGTSGELFVLYFLPRSQFALA